MELSEEPVIERYVRIINQDGELITVIEFISPANKKPPGLDQYMAKRSKLIEAGVHVVEVDLVRAGDWQAMFQPHVCSGDAISLYRVTVRTATPRRLAYVFPIRLTQPLPEIPVPLRAKDPKIMLALQPMIEAIYADGRYGSTLDYTRPLDPPLSADDQSFVTLQLTAGR
jgi:hypothetical protein